MVFSIPSEFYALEPSPEVAKCMETHAQELEKCSDALVTALKNIINDNTIMNELQTNRNAMPDSQKKIICCGLYSWDSCALRAVSTTSGCLSLVEEFLNKAEKEHTQLLRGNMDSYCVKFPKGSEDCLKLINV
jgi:hypothetical protein